MKLACESRRGACDATAMGAWGHVAMGPWGHGIMVFLFLSRLSSPSLARPALRSFADSRRPPRNPLFPCLLLLRAPFKSAAPALLRFPSLTLALLPPLPPLPPWSFAFPPRALRAFVGARHPRFVPVVRRSPLALPTPVCCGVDCGGMPACLVRNLAGCARQQFDQDFGTGRE